MKAMQALVQARSDVFTEAESGGDGFLTLWQSHSIRLQEILHGLAEELEGVDRALGSVYRLMESERREIRFARG